MTRKYVVKLSNNDTVVVVVERFALHRLQHQRIVDEIVLKGIKEKVVDFVMIEQPGDLVSFGES